ncbi:autotransporter domain-containing protein [Polynucleobacter sp. VK25]|uniref:autotransporter domain-containing protein n=1 Tax=Polynucleobacter sp. VK25 TaxID=1758398 RepID=UPI001BFDA211|nr:autotransporter domain-containing protein [Polynucleobacter sp. VK25]QWD67812.1 autotransporter domain-containing protein [Polynucleobacter sp. VK25]
MKKLKQKNIIFNLAILALGTAAANSSFAACAPNTSPSASCDGLVVDASVPSLTVNGGVTVRNDPSSGIAVDIQSPSGVVTNFLNRGYIGTSASLTFGVNIGGNIGTFTNNGVIQSYFTVIQQAGSTGSIGSLINNNRIESNDVAIQTASTGSIGLINNAGTIVSLSASNGTIDNAGAINVITNTGVITNGSGPSIKNSGTITTLNNAQSGLTYSGNLPTNYNIIIRSASNYGSTTFSNVAGSPTTFGFGSGSAISRSGTYADVLSGVTSSNLANTSGSIGGGVVLTQWNLTNTSGTDWSLTTTPSAPVAPKVTYSLAATSLAASLTTAYSIAAAGGSNPVLANGVTLGSAVQDLTTSQVNQLINVHAEGYSSNMTIGLEQMAHITNTVMDRIHAPMSASPSTKVYQDDEGRYIWADAAAVKGTVNNYNNLAGFGYNLYDLIIGGDIKRSKEGGYGVFAGTGSTSMTESQQVTQNFNTTNFYAGLYGARNFDAQVKLSGALGYMYGNTNANRNTPNVGLFTGGNATSSYKTNGVYAAAKLAKAYQAESFTVSPFVGASYSQLWMGGASEQGGNDFNFAISSATAYTAVTFAGLDFVYPLLKGTNDPLSLIGFYKFGYDWYANSNSAHSITATSPTYGSFTQVGANMGPVSNMVGLGIQGGITKEVSARIGAVASYNTYGHEYGGGAELRFKF